MTIITTIFSNHMASNIKVVLPGDRITVGPEAILGPGIYLDKGSSPPITCKAGMLRGNPDDRVWVDFDAKRYVPVQDDRVLGVVTKTTGKLYRVDIGSAVSAVLPELAFEGVTKRNKPNIQVGEVVYCRVSRAHKDIEPELFCVEPSGKGCGMGPLRPLRPLLVAYLFRCSIGLCRKLLSTPVCPILCCLGDHYKFEVTVGLNGAVWVCSDRIEHIILIVNAILSSQYMNESECKDMVKKLSQSRHS